MDEMVRAALRKWPNVPACFGWLGLDARGDWYMRDGPAQAAGPFPQSKGSRIEHEGLRAFIGRNYLADPQGRWYFQNGPQRVYVELEATPWVWRLQTGSAGAAPGLCSHTGRPAVFEAAWEDEAGRLLLSTDLGLGLVHTQDMVVAADAVLAGLWEPQPVRFSALLQRFGCVRSPQEEAKTSPA